MDMTFDFRAADNISTLVGNDKIFFDTNRLIRETFGEAGFAVPAQVHVFRNA